MDNKDPSALIILGNGFDIDLKFPTRYSDFVNSEMQPDDGGFPFVRGGHNYHELGKFVLEKSLDSWFDLEDLLAQYGDERCMVKRFDSIEHDKEDYQRLVKCLKLYLEKSINYDEADKESAAARFLSLVNRALPFYHIYSFNYTDFHRVSDALGLSLNDATYVHGSIAQDNIILGVGDYASLRRETDFFYKVNNPKWHKTGLMEDLSDADIILFFGLSLSRVDYPYFEDLFRGISEGKYLKENRKYIRIFTKDEASRESILRNLRSMNGNMTKLRNYADLEIIRTEVVSDFKMIDEIEDDIRNNYTWSIHW